MLSHDIESDGRESYLRAIVERQEYGSTILPLENQASGNLYSLVQANALMIVPAGVKTLTARSTVEFLPLSQFFS